VRFIARVVLLAISFAIGTWILGWWSVPVFAAVAGVLARDIPRQAIAAGVAAAVAWGALLTWSAITGSVWSFSRVVGGTVGVSGPLLILLTLLFPAALAWSAAAVAQFATRWKPGAN
jgi:hypothetical protein